MPYANSDHANWSECFLWDKPEQGSNSHPFYLPKAYSDGSCWLISVFSPSSLEFWDSQLTFSLSLFLPYSSIPPSLSLSSRKGTQIPKNPSELLATDASDITDKDEGENSKNQSIHCRSHKLSKLTVQLFTSLEFKQNLTRRVMNKKWCWISTFDGISKTTNWLPG